MWRREEIKAVSRCSSVSRLRDEFLRLLREDEEFRYAVAGYLGISEILKRLDKIESVILENTKVLQEHTKILQEHTRILQEHARAIRSLQEQVRSLQEQVRSLQEQVRSLQEQVLEHTKVLRRHAEILEQHTKTISTLVTRIDALGARWGLMAEEAFREGLRKVVQELLGVAKVDRWYHFDREGKVFGYPCMIEIDVVVKDNVHYLIEIKSSVDQYDVWAFNRKCELYRELNKVEVRKLVVTCFADDKSMEVAKLLGIEVVRGLA